MKRALEYYRNRAAIVVSTVEARFFHSMTILENAVSQPGWCLMAAVTMLLLSGCEKKETGTIDPKSLAPLVSHPAMVPSAVNIDTMTSSGGSYTITAGISVKVSDPDGAQDIRQVVYRIFPPAATSAIGSGQLAAVAGGVDSTGITYTANISFSTSRTTLGAYVVAVNAVDQSGLTSNVLQLGLIVGRNNISPVFGLPGARQTTPSGTLPAVFALSVSVSDSNGIADIQRVSVRVLSAQDTSGHLMFDNGDRSIGDKIAGDGIYSASLSVMPTGSLQDVVFEFSASDAKGAQAASVRRSLRNHPPRFTSVDVPASITKPFSGSIPVGFSVTVADTDGLGDIDSVYFKNFTPTPTASFLMYDDGDNVTHGDLVAGDGKYSIIVSIGSGNTTGPKEFHFYVVDKAGMGDEVVRIITINSP